MTITEYLDSNLYFENELFSFKLVILYVCIAN